MIDKIHYRYVIVSAAFLILFMMWGTINVFGVFLNSFLVEFDWSRAGASGAFSLALIMVGPMSIITGKLTDRLGPRLVLTLSGIFMGTGYILLSQTNSLGQFYLLYGSLIGIGISGSFVPLTSTVARWFVKRRGMMTGVAVAGLGFGTLVMPPIVTWLINSYGWRMTYIVMGIAVLVVVTAVAQLLRHSPQQIRIISGEGREAAPENLAANHDFTLREAAKTRQFWTLGVIWLIFCLSLGSVMAHIVMHTLGLGISAVNAAFVLSITGVFSTIGRIFMGSASDRIGTRKTLAICFGIIMVDLFWLLAAKELWMLCLFGALFGFGYGGVAALMSPAIAFHFGLASHGTIQGVLMNGSQIGEASGPVLTGFIFDITGSYYPAFLIYAVVTIIGFFLTFTLTPVRKKKV